jgi:hypothetical protein
MLYHLHIYRKANFGTQCTEWTKWKLCKKLDPSYPHPIYLHPQDDSSVAGLVEVAGVRASSVGIALDKFSKCKLLLIIYN